MINENSITPWGKAQSVEYITPWLTRVDTVGHGGYKVDKTHNKIIPLYTRKISGWYEEDCAWSIVFSTLEDLIRQSVFDSEREYCERIFQSKVHLETFKNWYPKEYENFFNVILNEGESHEKDKIEWEKKNKGKWHVVSASSLCNEWVLLTLCLDGEREHIRTPLERLLIVKEEEYKQGKLRDKFGTALTEEQINFYETIANNQTNCVSI